MSRSFFGKTLPKEKSAEFFGFYNIFGKFAAIVGPLLMAVFTRMTGDSRYGVLSLLILFLAGAFFWQKFLNREKNKKELCGFIKPYYVRYN